MKAIHQYTDHKVFLKDWFLERKKSPSGFSYERFSRLAGLASPNYMKMVIEGSRNLTVANIHQVAHGLQLGFDETQYFEALTLLGQSKTPSEKSYFKRRLRDLKKTKPDRAFELKHFELIAQWYFPAVIVVLDGCPVAEAAAAIRGKTGLENHQIEHVLSVLRQNGMLLEQDGRYKTEFSHFLVHDKKSLSEANKRYLRDQLRLGADLLEKKYAKGPKFFAHTFTVGKDAFDLYAGKIDSFLESLTAESNQESPDEILQLNLQFFKILDR